MNRLIFIVLILPALLQAQATRHYLQVQVYDMLSADSTNRVFDSTAIQRQIGYTQATVSADCQCVVRERRNQLAKFTVEYPVDSLMVKNGVLDVYVEDYEDNKLYRIVGLVRRNISEFARTGLSSTDWYDVSDTNIIIFNIPSPADSTDTLVVKYAAIAPDSLSDASSVTLIPDDYVLALVYKTCANLYLSRNLPEMAAAFEAYYDKEIGKRRSIYPPDRVEPVVVGAATAGGGQ